MIQQKDYAGNCALVDSNALYGTVQMGAVFLFSMSLLFALMARGSATHFVAGFYTHIQEINMPSNKDSGSDHGNTSKRGFASMDEDKQREIASKGGKAAHEKGTAHEFNSEEARRAGQKGGEAVSEDRRHMSEIGRKGGESSHGGSAEQHAKAGSQSHKDSDNKKGVGSTRGGSSEQHAKAGSQSHKNK